jgi:hypothetical protein
MYREVSGRHAGDVVREEQPPMWVAHNSALDDSVTEIGRQGPTSYGTCFAKPLCSRVISETVYLRWWSPINIPKGEAEVSTSLASDAYIWWTWSDP